MPPLSVVIAGESLRPPLTGIGRYTRELVAALIQGVGSVQPHLFLAPDLIPARLWLTQAGPTRATAYAAIRRRVRALPGAYDIFHRLRARAFARASRGMRLYHEPAYVLKPFDGAAVVTVHDLSHHVQPAWHPSERVRFLERHLPHSLERAQRVLVVSEFTRAELMRIYSVPAHKLRVTPLAAASSFRRLSDAQMAAVLRRYGLRKLAYLLTAATLEPRKNLSGLLAAFSRLPVRLRRAFPLAIAGTRGWRCAELEAQVEKMAARGEVIRLGYVPDEDLPALMNGCRAFAYPSLYEGFGLPLIEAQACGAAVLTSNRSALPEVAGPAALSVEPQDIEALTHALARLCEDDGLIARAQADGPAFAGRFTWAETARLTAQAYSEALACC
ncbi:MAG: glycosyltransferase family 1 protein [Burkholderiales bacterium]|nr:glycosyltransferase family 1 protein [Burkholderiales bacterium]